MEPLDLSQKTTTPSDFLKNKLQVDLISQSIILAIILLFAAMQNGEGFAISLYGVLGTYQLISSLIHLAVKPVGGLHAAYYPQLIIHVILLTGGIATENLGIMYFELFATPITALYFYGITIASFIHVRK